MTEALDSDPLLTITDIARELGLRSSAAVSNWRKRHPEFPPAADRADAGKELFRLSAVNAWLRSTGRDEIRLNPADSLWQQVRLGGLGRLPEESVLEGAIAVLTIHHRAAGSVARPYGSLRDLLGDEANPRGPLHDTLRALEIREAYWHAFDAITLLVGHTTDLVDAIEATDPAHAARAIDELLARWAIAAGPRGLATTSMSLARLAARLAPDAQQIYDPVCGTGNFFVAVLDEFVTRHTEPPLITGQEINRSAWSIAVLRLLSRDIDNFDLTLGDTLLADAHPELQVDLVIADPPYNQRDWGAERLLTDIRWRHGAPPDRDANTAWLQHALHHLARHGRAIMLLPLSSLVAPGRVGDIRRSMVAAGSVEAVVTLPAGLASFTNIPLAVWILRSEDTSHAGQHRVLLIDATGEPLASAGGADRALTPEAIDHIVAAVTGFRDGLETFEAEPGFAAVVTTHALLSDPGIALTPQRWVAASAADAEMLVDRFEELTRVTARSLDELRRAVPVRPLTFADPDQPGKPLALRDLEAAAAVEILRPARLDKSDYTTAGTPVLTQTALQRDGSPPRFERYVNLDTVGRQVVTLPGDVILATIGDRPYAVVDRHGGAVLGSNLELLRVHADWLDPELVAACLSSSSTGRATTGTVMKRVRLRDLSIPALSAETATVLRHNLRLTAELERAAGDVLRAASDARDLLIEAAVTGKDIAEAASEPTGDARLAASPTTLHED